MSNRIVIVGAGYSGTVMAANLLRRPPARIAEVVLIERSAVMGRGLAYAVHDCPYLLNVPAGRLSADPRYPLQFLSFARRTIPDADAEDFLPRQLYGDYMQDFLSQAEHDSARHVALRRVFGEVTRITAVEHDKSLSVTLAGGNSLGAERVILAVGNPPPQTLPCAEPVRHHPAYHDDPWDLPANLGSQQSVLIIGNGLTMADVAYRFSRDVGRAPRLITISRRGLLPLPQSTFRAAAVQGGVEVFAGADSIRALVSASRTLARDVEELGGDWREVVTFIRNLAPALWQRLPEAERRRFIRHVQGFWDIHRHRLPAELATRLERLRRNGLLEVNAGRIERMAPEGNRLRVTWRRRGRSQPETRVVDAVINATGPDYALKRSRDPLLKFLRGNGSIAEDALDLGVRTGSNGACLAADGRVSERLFYIGPMLRAGHWEATAAAELRNHAEALARHLAQLGESA